MNGRADVERWIKSCKACVTHKAPQPPKTAPLVSITTTEPMELVCIDYLKLDKCKGGYENVLVITDHFTRYAQAIPTLNQTAKTTARVLFNQFIVHYGFPKRIHADQGRNFESSIISELCKLASVTKSRTTPYHAMGNGMVERFNRTLIHMLGTLEEDNKANWKDFVAPLVHAYNSTRHDSTGVSPFYLMFGRHPRLAVDIYLAHDPNGFQPNIDQPTYIRDLKQRLDYAYKLAKKNSKISAEHQKKGYDNRTQPTSIIEPGDKVLVRNLVPSGKLDNFWEDSVYVVISKPNEDIPVFCVQREDGGRKRVLHRNLLMPCPTEGFRTTQKPQNTSSMQSRKQPYRPLVEAISSPNETPRERPKRTRRKPKRFNTTDWTT